MHEMIFFYARTDEDKSTHVPQSKLIRYPLHALAHSTNTHAHVNASTIYLKWKS